MEAALCVRFLVDLLGDTDTIEARSSSLFLFVSALSVLLDVSFCRCPSFELSFRLLDDRLSATVSPSHCELSGSSMSGSSVSCELDEEPFTGEVLAWLELGASRDDDRRLMGVGDERGLVFLVARRCEDDGTDVSSSSFCSSTLDTLDRVRVWATAPRFLA